jgi:hypothetical protein
VCDLFLCIMRLFLLSSFIPFFFQDESKSKKGLAEIYEVHDYLLYAINIIS